MYGGGPWGVTPRCSNKYVYALSMWGGIGMIYYVSYSYLINYPPNHTNFGMTPLPTPPYDAPWEGLGPGLRNFQDRMGPENCPIQIASPNIT